MRSTESQKLLGYQPIEITILHLLVMLILLIVKIIKVKKVCLFSPLNCSQAVHNRNSVNRYTIRGIPERRLNWLCAYCNFKIINTLFLPERNKRRVKTTLNRFVRILWWHVQINDGITGNKVGGIWSFVGIQSCIVHYLLLR